MGCTSSTEIVTDPKTGQQVTKHRLGGAHPGNRRMAKPAYTPNPADFNKEGQATAHFVTYGGGNALVLQQGGIAQPQSGVPVGKKPEYIQVTLPENVNAGDTIHVEAPDGRLNEIVVPDGFGPGSTFTVEFADGPPPANTSSTNNQSPYVPPVASATQSMGPSNSNNNDIDDGFASGFNNPNFVATASATTSYNSNDVSAYPTAVDAQPVYNSRPQHTGTVY